MTTKNTKKKTSTRTRSTSNRAERQDLGLNAPVQVNFTPEQRENVRSAAMKSGLSLSAFVRTAAVKAAEA